ncbi:hypothetical protein HELRODRAFT_169679 [Helobdella robusta]|uniref:Uncharacterized protein n=1 Tax=Helobdella robusta TaxID=6412 RepID=T1F279_HELRO|nr:hypothetical protein HELRODRAFT_169679 [Helobdella robusta]ESO07964.1 hypothetical protein HELRODRAFT_169679 [Helobdella robusta]
MKIRSGILPRLKQLKLPEEFIVEDQNGCDVTLRSFIQCQRMHACLGLKLPEEFIMEDVRLLSFIQRQRMHAWLGYVLFFCLCNLTISMAPVLEDNVGTEPHSTFCLCRMDDGKISALAVRLTIRSSDEIMCADQMMVAFNILPLSNGRK